MKSNSLKPEIFDSFGPWTVRLLLKVVQLLFSIRPLQIHIALLQVQAQAR
jgi:hypothetical protein